jgi:transposase
MAYSVDFRRTAVEYKDSGHTFKELKEVFGITNKTYDDWKKLYGETGSFEKREVKRQPKKINFDELKKALEEKPDAYLYELAEPFGCSEVAIHYALIKLGITYKKRHSPTLKSPKKNERLF